MNANRRLEEFIYKLKAIQYNYQPSDIVSKTEIKIRDKQHINNEKTEHKITHCKNA
jgi:hypothetical protein